jgi:hypothetical protein
MQHHTRPEPCPKPAVPSRSAAIEHGDLIEVEPRLARPWLPLPAALTEALLDLVEEPPFRRDGTRRDSTSPGARKARLIRAASAALGRAKAHYGPHLPGALMHGFVMDFCAELPRRTTEPRYPFIRLHCGPDENGMVVATLGLPDEL